jgi:hypothetical protein
VLSRFIKRISMLIIRISIIIKILLKNMESESDDWEPELLESQLVGHDPDDEF